MISEEPLCRITQIEHVPQLCEPFDPPHWIATCACGRYFIGFGEEDTQRWASEHGEGIQRLPVARGER